MQKRYFDTYGSTTISKSGENSGSLAITRQPACCNRSVVVTRRIFEDLDQMYDYAINETAKLNRQAVHDFLRWRPKVLRQVFDLADVDGLILTEGLLTAGLELKAHPVLRLPKMSVNRFIAICRILEKYRILYRIGELHFITAVGNAL